MFSSSYKNIDMCIMNYTDDWSLANLFQVSKKMYSIYKDPNFWILRIFHVFGSLYAEEAKHTYDMSGSFLYLYMKNEYLEDISRYSLNVKEEYPMLYSWTETNTKEFLVHKNQEMIEKLPYSRIGIETRMNLYLFENNLKEIEFERGGK